MGMCRSSIQACFVAAAQMAPKSTGKKGCHGRTATSGRCPRKPVSPRAKYCKQCFVKKAAASGQKGSGNTAARGVKGNKGNAAGAPGNKGNAAGAPGNKGNCRTGPTKKAAGKRSWLKRQAKLARNPELPALTRCVTARRHVPLVRVP